MSDFLMDAHFHFDLYKNRDEVLDYFEQKAIYGIAVTNLPSLFEKYSSEYKTLRYVRLALGYHPELISEYDDQMPIFLRNINKTRYIGEIGLDFTNRDPAVQKKQMDFFRIIVGECSINKILTVHSRKAAEETLAILQNFQGKVILHWYTGDFKLLNEALERGYFFSINHQMLRSANGRKVVDALPAGRILVETDAPFTYGLKENYNSKPIMDVYNYLVMKFEVPIDKVMSKIKMNFKNVLSLND